MGGLVGQCGDGYMITLEKLQAVMKKPHFLESVDTKILKVFPESDDESVEVLRDGLLLLVQYYVHEAHSHNSLPSKAEIRDELEDVKKAIKVIERFSRKSSEIDGFGYLISAILKSSYAEDDNDKGWSRELKSNLLEDICSPLCFLKKALDDFSIENLPSGRRVNIPRIELAYNVEGALNLLGIPTENKSIPSLYFQTLALCFEICEDPVSVDDIKNLIKNHMKK